MPAQSIDCGWVFQQSVWPVAGRPIAPPLPPRTGQVKQVVSFVFGASPIPALCRFTIMAEYVIVSTVVEVQKQLLKYDGVNG